MNEAAEITRRAKSNLAFALSVLPADKRADAVTYYAFCRTLDDLADDPVGTLEEREQALRGWKRGLVDGFPSPTTLQSEIVGLIRRHDLPVAWFVALAEGCLEDLSPRRYETWQELDGYIWKVAGAVGLVSARLFGCTDPGVDRYAETLGRALQLTNILRDVGEDWANDRRLYLPLAAFEAHGISEADLTSKPDRLLPLLRDLAARAEEAFIKAERLLPASDRKPLLPARIMAAIYRDLLRHMQADGFRVMEKRYRVPAWRKCLIAMKCRISS